MASHRVSRVPSRLMSVALALLVAGCDDARSTTPTAISIDSGQMPDDVAVPRGSVLGGCGRS